MIIFMGVSGSGKSMQGKMLADEMGYPWLSTGEFLRMLVSGQARRDMVAGKLLPDQDVIDMLDKILLMIDPESESVLDGFPRTSFQADWLLGQAKSGRLQITKVFHFMADDHVVKGRLARRSRVDDHEQAINERLNEYKTVTLPILDKFKQAGIKIHDINADQEVGVVHQEVMRIVRG